MNTIVGSACALGIDMGFNNKHHHDEDEQTTKTSVYLNGKEHNHHNEEIKNHHASKNDSEKNDCCNDKVIKFQNLEKNLINHNNSIFQPQLIETIVSTLWSINIFKCVNALPQFYRTRIFHPPILDILLAIQCFQI